MHHPGNAGRDHPVLPRASADAAAAQLWRSLHQSAVCHLPFLPGRPGLPVPVNAPRRTTGAAWRNSSSRRPAGSSSSRAPCRASRAAITTIIRKRRSSWWCRARRSSACVTCDSDEVIAFSVRGEEYQVVDIPPGYTHSIENVGAGELVTLFWSCELFDPQQPDTFFEPVLRPSENLSGMTPRSTGRWSMIDHPQAIIRACIAFRTRSSKECLMKVMTVVGTRPEIIRLSRVMAALDRVCRALPRTYRTEL